MSIDQLESSAAELLSQIHATVQEYVRLMNEAGARQRRESDEAHRQHEVALKSLGQLETSAQRVLGATISMGNAIRAEWPSAVIQGTRAAAQEEAKLYVDAHMSVAQAKLDRAAGQIVTLSDSLGWRQMVINAVVSTAVALGALSVVFWLVVGRA